MIKDDSARIPFVVIGILMIVVSIATAGYLLKMESAGVSNSIADEREGDLNYALACARADIDNALNVACIFAQSEVGDRPVFNVSAKSPYPGGPDEVNEARLKDMTYENLSQYLKANYQGGFVYGDYVVNASLDGDYNEVKLMPVRMNLTRTMFHPAIQCEKVYDAYYVVSVPVRLHVSKPGSNYSYEETYYARTLATSRYLLLKELTGEYEGRLNGTAMLTDVTAASFAYTWARGYCQYFTTEPMNIVDNNDIELMTNAGNMLEQGSVYNSVDPMGLASLIQHTYESSKSTGDVVNEDNFTQLNRYDLKNASGGSLPKSEAPKEYRFNASDIVDRRLASAIADPLSGYYAESVYGSRIHIEVKRRPLAERHNDSGIRSVEFYPLTPYKNGTGPFFAEKWKVWTDNSTGNGWAEEVTVTYVMDDYSGMWGQNNVLSPHEGSIFQSLDFERYDDSNLVNAVNGYHSRIDFHGVLFDRNGYPDGFSGLARQFTCPHAEWAGNATVTELEMLAGSIKKDVSVTLDLGDYGSYDEMMSSAYGTMYKQFERNYTEYLSDYRFMEKDDGGAAVYRSCGAKYVYNKRSMFLDGVRKDLNQSVHASEDLNNKIDEQLKKYSSNMNSSTMKNGSASSKKLLDETTTFIPFGLNMTLTSREEQYGPYTWKEDVTLAVDQRPNYLYTAVYTDPETGYSTRPLKIRNVCLFTLPTDFVESEQASQAVLDGIDAVSNSAYRLANDTITSESKRLVGNVTDASKAEIKRQINKALVNDSELSITVTRTDVNEVVDNAFNNRTPEQAVEDLKNGMLQQEIAKGLGDRAKQYARQEMARNADKYVDTYGDYVGGKTEELVTGAEETAISFAIGSVKGEIKHAFKDYTAEATKRIEEKAVSEAEKQALKAGLKCIPCGLPLLPPWGWWATMNVWYIEIHGEIPYLTVYDTDMEPVPDPILGHRATAYTRRSQVDISNGEGIIGDNTPIRFTQKTCTFIVVPPGEQGIGDKIGGWDETSPGFGEA